MDNIKRTKSLLIKDRNKSDSMIVRILKKKFELQKNKLSEFIDNIDPEVSLNDESVEAKENQVLDNFENLTTALNQYESMIIDILDQYEDVVKQLRIEKTKNKMLEDKLLALNSGHMCSQHKEKLYLPLN